MSFPSTITRRCLALSTSEIFSIASPTRNKARRTPNLQSRKSLNFQESMPELEISRSKELKASKMSKLRGGLEIKHTASHRCPISSFEKGKSCGSFPGLRQHHRHLRRAPYMQLAPVRSHRAAFFHIRQQRWFGRFASLFFLERLARRYAARHAGTLPYLFSGVLQSAPQAIYRA